MVLLAQTKGSLNPMSCLSLRRQKCHPAHWLQASPCLGHAAALCGAALAAAALCAAAELLGLCWQGSHGEIHERLQGLPTKIYRVNKSRM